jgi:hypothetical protein
LLGPRVSANGFPYNRAEPQRQSGKRTAECRRIKFPKECVPRLRGIPDAIGPAAVGGRGTSEAWKSWWLFWWLL